MLRNKACLWETQGGRGQGVCSNVWREVQQSGKDSGRELGRKGVRGTWNGKLRGRTKAEHERIEEKKRKEGSKARLREGTWSKR